ncbi:hypothetical protein P3T27_000834 [Kitasatospora sp. MAA19]|uniref:hypothetical protein n=1 Tax=Kitasatospora sp. MAA19 TaxID=3035090 RepID=UPI0024732C2A|nr:hypothetical protein [Kitasatospora sp. MAA19]MDH6704133.1 hypothetical protein [Kitasatospora sp. MAA19]
MMLSVASGRSVDLRVEPVEEVLGRVEQRLLVDLDRATVVRKRRSVGARTNRGTWVRVERREPARVRDHGWNGTECAEALTGIAKPDWLESAAWHDSSDGAMWRADETTLLPGQPVGNSVLATDPQLPDEWWSELGASLDALAGQRTARIATPDTELITQALVDQTIQTAFSSQADTAIRQWVPAHADLNWANTTGPQFCLFDWEDWGNAPQGLDSASLLGASLAVPALAERVRRERSHDLESRDGKVMTLFVFAKFAGPDAHPDDPRVEAARHEAVQLLKALQTT